MDSKQEESIDLQSVLQSHQIPDKYHKKLVDQGLSSMYVKIIYFNIFHIVVIPLLL